MDQKRIVKRIGLFLMGQILFFTPLAVNAQDDADANGAEEVAAPIVGDAENGMALFQGGERFINGGPTCVTCHNVTHEGVMPGGLFAKDLTDVYTRLGEGLVSWLAAPPFPAMDDTYSNNVLTKQERNDLTAFLKVASETQSTQDGKTGYMYFILGGGIVLVVLLVLIQLLWSNRKKKMVKADIFARQNKAWDAKF